MARNIFTRFDKIRREAGEGNPYAMRYYLRYLDIFKDDIELIKGFIYNEKDGKLTLKKSNNNLETLEKKSNEKNVIVFKKFITFANELPSCFKVWVGGLFNLHGVLKEDVFKTQTSNNETPKSMVSEEDYLKNRYYNQQKWLSNNAGVCKEAHISNQKAIMKISVAISILSVLSVFVCNLFVDYGWIAKEHIASITNGFNVIVAILSAVTAYISSNDKFYQHLAFWIRHRSASESLKSEYALYQGLSGDYDIEDDDEQHSKAQKLFRQRVELIIQNANDNWVKSFQSENNKNSKS